ncbi:hypothetical protein JCM10207_000229 [Rhodosporidiobolus poonsookiae]
MSSTTPPGTVAYHEPSFPHLAVLISLLYLVQLFRGIANRLLGAGLLGEIAVGVIYGPCAKILDAETERVFVAVGYIGLVLIVFEGGLTLNARAFLSQLPLAVICAVLGVLLPIAFTFALFSASSFGYPTLQAFTAGSALASTSLGTTFFVLRSAGPTLGTTRVAEVLKGAALVDDVIALVLLSVLQALGPDPSSVSGLGWVIGRPVVASLAMAAVAPLVALYIARPLFRRRKIEGLVKRGGMAAELLLGLAVLIAFLAIAYYAGTTMLLGAFLAGVFLQVLPSEDSGVSFVRTWDAWILPLHEHILVPLFFASIGFSIPFLSLWTGARIWRGIVYALLMALAKVLAGAPLLLVDACTPSARLGLDGGNGKEQVEEGAREKEEQAEARVRRDSPSSGDGADVNPPSSSALPTNAPGAATTADATPRSAGTGSPSSSSATMANATAPRTRGQYMLRSSLPVAGFLGFALVARGEIGVLILQVAYTSAASSPDPAASVLSEEPYLLGIWAVALCTIVGPVVFSALVRRYGAEVVRGRWGAM